ncbi:unnamed protein product, partial [Polarella glacialis]
LAAVLFSACRREDVMNTSDPAFETPLSARLVSEFFGTFMLTLTFGLNVVMKSVATPFSAGAALICMVYSLGDVSGAHFNPAVTLAVVLSGRGQCSVGRGLAYCAVQLLAGIVAGMLFAEVQFYGPWKNEDFSLHPKNGFSWLAVFVAELAFTFLLAFVVLAVATTRSPHCASKQNFHFGLAIGVCVVAGGFAVGAISGASSNPAVAWSLATAEALKPGHHSDPSGIFQDCLAFCLFELVGAVLAAAVFGLTHASEFRKPGALLV